MLSLDLAIESTPAGPLMLLRTGCPVSDHMRRGAQWDWHVCAALESHLGGLVLDIGANVGAITRWLAPRAPEVWAFEPHPQLFEALEHNTREFGNVKCFPFGLYSREIRMMPYEIEGIFASAWIWNPSAAEGEGILAKPLLAEGTPRVSAIKVDTQGADLHCLQGCEEIILRDHPAIAFEFEVGGVPFHSQTWEDYLAQFAAWDYGAPTLIHEGLVDWFATWGGER